MMNIRYTIPVTIVAILLMVFAAAGLSGQDLFESGSSTSDVVAVGEVSIDEPQDDELPDLGESDEDGFGDDEFGDDGFEDDELNDDGFEDEEFDEDEFDEGGRDEDDAGEQDEDDESWDDEEEDRDRRRGFGRREREMGFEEEIDEFDDDVFTMEQMELASWIGVELGPLDPAVAAHVSLEEGQGLMVYEVLPGSPAETAGFQQFDILLSVAGMPLQDVVQLRDKVQQSKGTEFSVEILRKGTKQQLQITPGDRPWSPDVYFPGSVEIPENVEVTISRQGSGPLTVTVREGDQTWTAASEEEFEQLPDKVVMWLFETMNEFMPFDEEEEFGDDWDEDDWSDEDGRGFDEEEFGPGERDEEEYRPDRLEERINALEGRIERILGRIPEDR